MSRFRQQNMSSREGSEGDFQPESRGTETGSTSVIGANRDVLSKPEGGSEGNLLLGRFNQAVSRLKRQIQFYLKTFFSQGEPKNQSDTSDQAGENSPARGSQGQLNQGLGQSTSSGRRANQRRPKMTRRQFLITAGTGGLGLLVAGYFSRIELARILDKFLFSPEKLVEVSLSEILKSILDSSPRDVEQPAGEISKNFARNFADFNDVRKIEQLKLFTNPFLPGEYILLNPSETFSGVFLEKPRNSQPLELNRDSHEEKSSSGSNWDIFVIGEYLKIAGFGIITDARGLWDGQQEYCAIFVDDNKNYLAIGYEGGLYGYDFQQKEWRRLVNSNGKYLQVEAEWKGLNIEPPKMSEQVISGLKVFRDLGYRPYPIVRGDVQMPEMNEKEGKFAPKNFYSEKNQYGRYLFGESGEIIDLVHAVGMAEKLVLAVIQMLKQYDAQTQTSANLSTVSFRVEIPHFVSNENFPFEYQCDLNVKGLDEAGVIKNILLIGFLLIQATGFLMETVSQRAVKDLLPIPLSFVVGMTPEDMYSNSLGMWVALEELSENFLCNSDKNEITKLKNNQIRQKFLSKIRDEIVRKFGSSKTPTEEVKLQTLGMYPFIPIVDPEAFRAQGGQITNPFVQGSESFQKVLQQLKQILADRLQIKILELPYFAYNVKRVDGGIR